MRKKRSQIIFIAPLLVIAVGALFLSIFIKKSIDTRVLLDNKFIDNSEKTYDDFTAENVSLVKKRNSNIFFTLTANKVTHRKRISKLFVYQNIKEIFISGAKMDIFIYNNSSPLTSNDNSPFIAEIISIPTSFGKPPTSIEDYLNSKVRDSDLEILSRMIFEDISINIYLSENKRISITSINATINADLENIVFAGDVKITDSNNRYFCSSKAVWSQKYKGIYFPEGYVIKNREYKNKALYSINEQGEFLKGLSALTIQYLDLIEKNENEINAKLFKKLPPQVKLMLGLQPSQ